LTTARAGLRQTAAARTYGVSLRAVNTWVAIDKVGGLRAFMVFVGTFKAPVCVAFLQRLLKQIAGKIYLIVDGHPVHKSGNATRFAATHSARLRLIRMPGYCPELNPDEWLNQDVKTNGLGKGRPTDPNSWPSSAAMYIGARSMITNLFREQQVRDAA